MSWFFPSSYTERERRELVLQFVAIGVAITMWVAGSMSGKFEAAPPFGDPGSSEAAGPLQ